MTRTGGIVDLLHELHSTMQDSLEIARATRNQTTDTTILTIAEIEKAPPRFDAFRTCEIAFEILVDGSVGSR